MVPAQGISNPLPPPRDPIDHLARSIESGKRSLNLKALQLDQKIHSMITQQEMLSKSIRVTTLASISAITMLILFLKGRRIL